MAAAAAAAAASAGTNATAGTSSTGGLTSSEYEELVGEVVSESPHMNLADLEAKLEIIRPEDLQVWVGMRVQRGWQEGVA